MAARRRWTPQAWPSGPDRRSRGGEGNEPRHASGGHRRHGAEPGRLPQLLADLEHQSEESEEDADGDDEDDAEPEPEPEPNANTTKGNGEVKSGSGHTEDPKLITTEIVP